MCIKTIAQHINGVDEIEDKLRKLFVGGLSETTTEDSGKEYFSQFGDVENINILRYKYNKKCYIYIKL